jgi:restriction system protein
MYMSRSPQGTFAKKWESEGIIAIGYRSSTDLGKCKSIDDVRSLHTTLNSGIKRNVSSDVSQLSKFLFDLVEGVDVVTYDPEARQYLVGTIAGPYEYRPGYLDGRLPHVRAVKWKGRVRRDDLTPDTRNTLGSLLTIYRLSDDAAADIRNVLSGSKPEAQSFTNDTSAAAMLPADSETPSIDTIEDQARELVKDRINNLDWQQMQDLVAGILRAMGYKTRVSPAGADRGRDIIASRDGLGLQPPRIVAQVKHRKGQSDAASLRSFIGALDDTDRGLFVSTSGFSKDARYEADRSVPPIALLDLDELATVLVENYDSADVETRELVALKAVYWPA